MKTVKNIKIVFWVSLIFALIFVTYLKQVYLFKSVLNDYVGSQAVLASWALAIITELIRGAFAYASFLASEKNFTQTKTISLLISVGISLFDFWEIYHYLDAQAISYTAYFLVSITLALELLGGVILAEINEAHGYELEEQETTVDTIEEISKIHSPFVNKNTFELVEEKNCIIKEEPMNIETLLSTIKTVRKRTTQNRKIKNAMVLTLF